MSKEIKAIINDLEEERERIRTKCLYPEDVLDCEDLIKIMNYIKQLKEENNKKLDRLINLEEKTKDKINELQQRIDKAIEYMKYNATSNYFDEEKNMFRREIDLLEILKGGNNG